MAIDLTGPWPAALIDAGFDPCQPSGWLLEGFLFYLPNDRVTRLLDQVTSLAAPGSWLGFDIVNAITLTFPLTRPWVEMQAQAGAPWLGTMEDPVGFLAERAGRPRSARPASQMPTTAAGPSRLSRRPCRICRTTGT